jgi:hypothetical protein
MSLEQTVFTPFQVPVQTVCVVTVQVSAAAPAVQHAPVGVGWGQASKLQIVFAPRQVPLHWACVVIVQLTAPAALLTRQQAPVTGVGLHSVAVQIVLFP